MSRARDSPGGAATHCSQGLCSRPGPRQIERASHGRACDALHFRIEKWPPGPGAIVRGSQLQWPQAAMPRDSLAPREDFSALRQFTYLNAASIAITPAPVRNAKAIFESRIGEVGTVNLDEEAETQALDSTRALGAQLLGSRVEDIAILTSATEGLCQLAWGIKPPAGSNIVSLDLEFPSVVYPWIRVAQETGAEVRLIRALDSPAALSIDDIANAIDGRTAVLCVSHVQYASGHRFDLGELAALAHRQRSICIVDATQSAGVVPIDVDAAGVDALVAAGYKWLCGPFGAALLYVAPSLRDRLTPPIVGWRSSVRQFDFDATEMALFREARKFESGTMNYASGFGLGEAIKYLMRIGIDEALSHVLQLTGRLIRGLQEMDAEVLTPVVDELRSGIVTARFPGVDGESVARELNRRGVIVSPRFGSTRISPHVYNHDEDVDRALEEIRRILKS